MNHNELYSRQLWSGSALPELDACGSLVPWWQAVTVDEVHAFLVILVTVDGQPVFRDALTGHNLAEVNGEV